MKTFFGLTRFKRSLNGITMWDFKHSRTHADMVRDSVRAKSGPRLTAVVEIHRIRAFSGQTSQKPSSSRMSCRADKMILEPYSGSEGHPPKGNGIFGGEEVAVRVRTTIYLAGILIFMFGLSYAAIPLYQIFCQVSGFGGTVQKYTESNLSDTISPPSVGARTSVDQGPGLKQVQSEVKEGEKTLGTLVPEGENSEEKEHLSVDLETKPPTLSLGAGDPSKGLEGPKKEEQGGSRPPELRKNREVWLHFNADTSENLP